MPEKSSYGGDPLKRAREGGRARGSAGAVAVSTSGWEIVGVKPLMSCELSESMSAPWATRPSWPGLVGGWLGDVELVQGLDGTELGGERGTAHRRWPR